ncbi:MAG: InlB B-repeat-containing protein, partial [Eubacteriales bacterium]|nr:InlB B-repeat-containing protein [Eubacteriales bacterium]
MMKKLVMMFVATMAAIGAMAVVEKSAVLGDWYEAHLDNKATTCARWDDFWMGANVAIPVTGLTSPILASDIVVTAGTYSEFGTPYVLTEAEMWNRYGAPVYNEKNLGNVEFDSYDNVWQNWEAEENGAYGYELSADIWPDWFQVSGRQWILIPTGVPRLGTHTFSVKINGVEHNNYVVSFVMAEDQEPEPYGCQVTFNPKGGEVVEDNREVVAGKSIGTLPTPTRSKYKFLGWYTAPEGGTKISATTKVTGNVTYYAQWVYDGSAIVSAVVAQGCEAMGKVTGGKTAKAGTKLTLKATANKGYVFSYWEGPLGDAQDSRNPSISYVVGEDDAEFVARFIPVEDDVAAISFTMSKEYENGVVIDNVAIDVSGCISLPTVKVTGLPAGLKFTAKDVFKNGSKTEVEVPANTIYGTPTKSGVYTVVATVTTAGKKTATCSQTVIVRKEGEKVVVAECDVDGGKVTGGGVYATGKNVALKATANKGYVFAGWYYSRTAGSAVDGVNAQAARSTGDAWSADLIPCDSTLTDYRNPNYSYVMGVEDKTFYARFEPSAADTNLNLTVGGVAITPEDTPLKSFTVGSATNLPLVIDSLSLPKASVKGLPTGMKFTEKPILVKGSKTEIETP